MQQLDNERSYLSEQCRLNCAIKPGRVFKQPIKKLPMVLTAVLGSLLSFQTLADNRSAVTLPIAKILIAKSNMSQSLFTIALLSIVERLKQINQEVEKSGTQNLQNQFDRHQQHAEQLMQDMLQARQLAKIAAMEASMAQHAALSEQAFELGQQTHETLVRIAAKTTQDIETTVTYQAGFAEGQMRYNRAALQRGVALSYSQSASDTHNKPMTDADKATDTTELRPSVKND